MRPARQGTIRADADRRSLAEKVVRTAGRSLAVDKGTWSRGNASDIQALWLAWYAGEIPDPADGDEVVQPKSRPKQK